MEVVEAKVRNVDLRFFVCLVVEFLGNFEETVLDFSLNFGVELSLHEVHGHILFFEILQLFLILLTFLLTREEPVDGLPWHLNVSGCCHRIIAGLTLHRDHG